MSIRIAHASKDENGKYTNGIAGDQTGKELFITPWYNRPWNVIIRPYNTSLGIMISNVAQRLVRCEKIGYDQNERTSLYSECEKIKWDINSIDKINYCECDCSSFIAVVLRFCGVEIPKNVYTGNLVDWCAKTGLFIFLYDSIYLNNDRMIRKGDILLNTRYHVAVALDNGDKVVNTFTAYAGVVNVNTYLQVRTSPNGDEYMVGTESLRLPRGMTVAILDEVDGWGRLADIAGWVYLRYIIKGKT